MIAHGAIIAFAPVTGNGCMASSGSRGDSAGWDTCASQDESSRSSLDAIGSMTAQAIEGRRGDSGHPTHRQRSTRIPVGWTQSVERERGRDDGWRTAWEAGRERDGAGIRES